MNFRIGITNSTIHPSSNQFMTTFSLCKLILAIINTTTWDLVDYSMNSFSPTPKQQYSPHSPLLASHRLFHYPLHTFNHYPITPPLTITPPTHFTQYKVLSLSGYKALTCQKYIWSNVLTEVLQSVARIKLKTVIYKVTRSGATTIVFTFNCCCLHYFFLGCFHF